MLVDVGPIRKTISTLFTCCISLNCVCIIVVTPTDQGGLFFKQQRTPSVLAIEGYSDCCSLHGNELSYRPGWATAQPPTEAAVFGVKKTTVDLCAYDDLNVVKRRTMTCHSSNVWTCGWISRTGGIVNKREARLGGGAKAEGGPSILPVTLFTRIEPIISTNA